MSHEISDRDADRMLWVGERPWHGLGTQFSELQDPDAVVAHAFPWKVEARPTQFLRADGTLAKLEDSFVNVRVERDGTEVGLGTTGSRYTIFQAETILDALKPLELRYETAGSLWDGRKCWALAPVGHVTTIRTLPNGNADREGLYLAVNWSHDGTQPIDLRFTRIREVCANTREVVLRDGRMAVARVRHTESGQFRLDEAVRLMRSAQEVADRDDAMLRGFALQSFDRTRFTQFAGAVLLGVDPKEGDDRNSMIARVEEAYQARTQIGRAKLDNQLADLIAHFEQGTGNTGESKYDALNALTEWVDQKRIEGKTAAERMTRMWRQTDAAMNGLGADRKRRAPALLSVF